MINLSKKNKLLILGICSFALIITIKVNVYAKSDNKNILNDNSCKTTNIEEGVLNKLAVVNGENKNPVIAKAGYVSCDCQAFKEVINEYKKYVSVAPKKETIKKENFTYLKEIKMPKKHQEYLYKMCKKRNLDYLKTLAIIENESQFNSQAISKSNDYGYMQINKVNHKYLAKKLKTENKPLDPYVNINWGTYMLSELYKQWEAKGISNKIEKGEVFSQLDKYVMSSYNKGVNGFKKHGIANKYIGTTRGAYRNLRKFNKN